MGTFDALDVGDTFTTPSLHVAADLVATLIGAGGYTHPLFTDPAYAAASPFGRTPLPGQAVLLLMGGLIEQSNRFDDTTIALAGFDEVRFRKPAFDGDTLHVVATVASKERGESRGTIVFAWQCRNDRGDVVADATARMLFRL